MLNNENQETYNHINSVRVRSFRSHNDIELSPGKSSVLIVGNNGVGKTSILEALSIFSHGKGIRNNSPGWGARSSRRRRGRGASPEG